MKTTEQLAVGRMLAEQNFLALETIEITPRLATRYNRLRHLYHAYSLRLAARLDGRFLVEVEA